MSAKPCEHGRYFFESCAECMRIENEALRATVRELRKRVRLARIEFFACKFVARPGTSDTDAMERFLDRLDLRVPLPARRGRRK